MIKILFNSNPNTINIIRNLVVNGENGTVEDRGVVYLKMLINKLQKQEQEQEQEQEQGKNKNKNKKKKRKLEDCSFFQNNENTM